MNLKNKRILLRVDFNVPIKNGRVMDDFRIDAHVPTIKYYLKKGAQIFLISHLEENNKIPHLSAIHKTLEKKLKFKIKFIQGIIPEQVADISEKIILFDNVRLNPGEKKNDIKFARRLAAWGDYYVDDAFSAAHRSHASIVLLPRLLPHEAGLLLKKEIKHLSKFFNPKHPFLFILGGKKFETKEPLITKFIKKADAIFIGGALGNAFLAGKGVAVGRSEIDKARIPEDILWNNKIMLPEDAVVLRSSKKKIILLNQTEKNDLVYDAGPKTTSALEELAVRSRFVLWNGPLGLYEKGFMFGTKELARALKMSRAFKVLGGGDTVAAIRKVHLEKNFDFISTGGGAMLEFLAKGTLPGIEALKIK